MIDKIKPLLPKKYRKLFSQIEFIIHEKTDDTKFDITLSYNTVYDALNPLNQLLGNFSCNDDKGYYDDFKIHLFKYNCRSNFEATRNIIHEIRHAYQFKYMSNKVKFKKSLTNYSGSGDSYWNNWLEVDANRYADNFMKRNGLKEEVNE